MEVCLKRGWWCTMAAWTASLLYSTLDLAWTRGWWCTMAAWTACLLYSTLDSVWTRGWWCTMAAWTACLLYSTLDLAWIRGWWCTMVAWTARLLNSTKFPMQICILSMYGKLNQPCTHTHTHIRHRGAQIGPLGSQAKKVDE